MTSVAHLLTSNCVASEDEAMEIRAMIATATEDLSKLNTQIDSLCLEREQLVQHLDALKRVTSPVRRLMPELVAEIFQYCQSGKKICYARHRKFENPFLIGQICSGWRRVALSMPSLWASIHLILNSLSITRQIRSLETYLERSNPRTLSIIIQYESLELQISDLLLHLIQILQSCSRRWRNLDLRLTDWLLEELMDGLQTSSDLSSLETFTLHSTWMYSPYPPPITHGSLPKGVTLNNAPVLRSLSLDDTYMDTADLITHFPLHQLTHLSIHVDHIIRPTQFSGRNTAKFFSLCPTLQEFNLASVSNGEGDTDEFILGYTEMVTLPDLHTPELRLYGDLRAILDKLVLPNLRHLRMERRPNDPTQKLLHRSKRVLIDNPVRLELKDSGLFECEIGPGPAKYCL